MMNERQFWPGWETVRVMGSGGFGKVYEIRKIENSRTGEYRSALKVISVPNSPDEYDAYKDDGYDDAGITAVFKSRVDDIVSEFALMSQFKGTANIVSYEDHMIVPHGDGHGWDVLIRMELLTSLPEYFSRYGLDNEGIVKLGVDICRALELCAQKNVIHRDIKPQNIFINRFGDFKLGDFGIARAMDHTTKATKVGTYSYMAPEVYRGRPYNATADIYSLGLVLYWLLNERRLPFLPLPPTVPTASQNSEAHLRRMSNEALPAPKSGSNVLRKIVLKACAYNPSQRFSSAREMRTALEHILAYDNTVAPKREAYEADKGRPRKTQGATDGASAAHAPQSSYNYAYNKGERRDNVRNDGNEAKAAGASGTSPNNICPWCNGSGREILLEQRGINKYTAGEDSCVVCQGTGRIAPEYVPLLTKQSEDLKLTPQYKVANRLCDCCKGMGWVHVKKKPGVMPCPKCEGRPVKYASQSDTTVKSAVRRLSVFCALAYFPLSILLGVFLFIILRGLADSWDALEYTVFAVFFVSVGLMLFFALRGVRKASPENYMRLSMSRLLILFLCALATALLIQFIPADSVGSSRPANNVKLENTEQAGGANAGKAALDKYTGV